MTMGLDVLHANIQRAETRIRSHVRYTPVEEAAFLGDMAGAGARVYLKMESEQVTGSFKARGACNKVLELMEQDGERVRTSGVVLASTGNHALACLYILQKVGVAGTVFCPSTISPAKEAALRRQGAVLTKCGPDPVSGEIAARAVSQNEGKPFVSPYNDIAVVAGQGTIGIELLEQLPALDAVFVGVGGGGLIAGIAAYVKHTKPGVKVVGCTPRNSKVMYESVRAGRIIEEESLETLSEGTAGGVEEGAVTFPLCAAYVDEWVVVEEEEIESALYQLLAETHKLVEGAAAMTTAGFIKVCKQYSGQTVAIVSCGANVGMETVKRVVNKYCST